MQKVIIICFYILIGLQCSVVRVEKFRQKESELRISNQQILEDVIKQNVTKESFNIAKAEINILDESGVKRIVANIKYKKIGDFLISIKTRLGIEIARVFISKDSIFINDRINRKLYYGETKYLESRYGIPISGIPLFLGDYLNVNSNFDSFSKGADKDLLVDNYLENFKISNQIDCNKKKTVNTLLKSVLTNQVVSLQFSKFIKDGYIIFPGKIKVVSEYNHIRFNIKIKNIDTSWNGEIKFIPGKNYDIIELI